MGIGFRSGGGNGWNFDVLLRAVRRGGNSAHRLLPKAERQKVAELLGCLPIEVDQPPEARTHFSKSHLPSLAGCDWCRAEAICVAICGLLARQAKTKEQA